MQWLPQWKGQRRSRPGVEGSHGELQAAATANNFASMEKLPRFDRIRGNYRLPRPANQGKQPN
jgi:hypothetical protein